MAMIIMWAFVMTAVAIIVTSSGTSEHQKVSVYYDVFNKSSSCEMDITVSRGLIVYHDCTSSIKIETVFGIIRLLCSEMINFRLFGPAILIDKNKICHLHGLKFCSDEKSPNGKFDLDCNGSVSNRSYLLPAVLITLLIIQYSFMRYLWITRIKTIRNHVILSKQGGPFTFKLEIQRKVNDLSVSYMRREKPKFRIDTPSIKFLHYNKKTLILAILLFRHPVPTTVGHVIPNNPLNTIYTQSIEVQSGHWIILNDNHFIIPKTTGSLLVNKAYKTGDFVYNTVKDWHCHESSCSSHGQCGVTGRYGTITSEKLWKEGSSNKTLIYRQRYCEYGTTGCFLADGCWKWVIEHRVKSNTIITVKDIVSQSLSPRTINVRGANCEMIINQSPASVNIIGKTIISRQDGSEYYCPFESNRLKPLKGELGDVQIFDENRFISAVDKVICTKDDEYGPVCDIVDFPMKKLYSNCMKLPAIIHGYKIESHNAGYSLEYIEPETALLRCDSKQEFRISSSECGGVKWDLWYKEGGEETIMLHGRVNSFDQNRSIVALVPCTEKEILINCNEAGVSVSISWSDSCMDNGNLSSKNVITNHDIKMFKELVFKGHYSELTNEDPIFTWQQIFKNPFNIGLSSFNVLFIVLMIVLCVRK